MTNLEMASDLLECMKALKKAVDSADRLSQKQQATNFADVTPARYRTMCVNTDMAFELVERLKFRLSQKLEDYGYLRDTSEEYTPGRMRDSFLSPTN